MGHWMDELLDTNSIVKSIINRLISCSDGKHITEIYAKNGSIIDGKFTDRIGLMIETDPDFINDTLYDTIDDIEEKSYPFTLVISIEPDMAERGHGYVLYRRSE